MFAISLRTPAIKPAPARLALVLVCLLAIATPRSTLHADDADQLSQAIAALVVRLDSAVFAEREEAARQLREFGFFAIEPVTQAAQTGSLEVAVRAVEILEAIYQTAGGWLEDSVGKPADAAGAEQTDPPELPFEQVRKFGREPQPAVDTANAAESALEQLRLSTNRSVAGRAAAALERNYAIRERLALAAIRKLGGAIDRMDPAAPQAVVRLGPNVEDIEGEYFVRLDSQWTGGDAGLEQIKRLTLLRTLYIIDGTPISPEAVKNLQAALPNLNVQRRGEAFLGISGTPNQFGGLGCLVDRVTPGGAADRAGIRRGDMIVHFGGKPVTDFVALIDLIGTYRAGDKVMVELRRDGRMEELEVVLDRWSGPSS